MNDYKLFYLFSLILVIVSFFGSFALTAVVKRFSTKNRIVDDPSTQPHRKHQKQPVPLLGGLGFTLIAGFLTALVWVFNYFNWLELDIIFGDTAWNSKILWVLLSIGVITFGGFLDDRFHLSPKYQLVSINIALFITIFIGDITISELSKPFDSWFPNFEYLPHVLTYIWLNFCVGATKFLDGHDGLVSTVGIVALLTISSVSWFTNINEPLIFLLALIWAAGIAGFLPWNFPNARIYLGEGASELIGYMIGILAIFSGAKVATASTVIGYFIVDLLFVWILRLKDKRNPFTSGDRFHWHHRLQDVGLSKIQVLVITALILLTTAHIGLWVPAEQRTEVLIGQTVFLVIAFSVVSLIGRRKG